VLPRLMARTLLAAPAISIVMLQGGGVDLTVHAQPAQPASNVSKWTLTEAIAKGPLLLNRDAYQVFAVRRDRPGSVEHHTLDTDVIFVLEGAATFVTGGTIENSREVRANELTGTAILNGHDARLEPGDVIAVPSGTPHWFRDVSPSISYYAVKVREPNAGAGRRVVHVQRAKAFERRGPLFDQKESTSVRVFALSYNRSPLPVELHERETDIVFVTAGSGTFVTGGVIVDPRRIGPGEGSGSSIRDGVEQRLTAGTALVIPGGTPHWLRTIDGNLEFFAVKMP
jgi:mannose-6-phosphate isomerase-like protein (cupin superfamily)